MNDKLGIVVIGYKNAVGIKRLLDSLSAVNFEGADNVLLIISIDYSGDQAVEELAKSFNWTYGEKIVKAYEENLGLQRHILKCGEYIEEYSLDALAVLEDDIVVSPAMFGYMKSSVAFYKDDPNVAGISLYKHEQNLLAKKPFYEMNDGGDTFFIQYAQSWGQIWLRRQWDEFKEWYEKEKWSSLPKEKIPRNVLNWSNSWLKYHIMYCIDRSQYFVYPRTSFTTNFSDAGTHRKESSTQMQDVLWLGEKRPWCFNKLEDTLAVYDAFFENVRLQDLLKRDDLIVDMYGVKDEKDRYLLTTKKKPYKVVSSWGLLMRPIEQNIFSDIKGNDIFLYDTSENAVVLNDKKHSQRVFNYELRGVNILRKEALWHALGKLRSSMQYRIKIFKKKIMKSK